MGFIRARRMPLGDMSHICKQTASPYRLFGKQSIGWRNSVQRPTPEIVYFSWDRLKYRLTTAASEVPTMSRNEIALITGVLPSRTWR